MITKDINIQFCPFAFGSVYWTQKIIPRKKRDVLKIVFVTLPDIRGFFLHVVKGFLLFSFSNAMWMVSYLFLMRYAILKPLFVCVEQ